MSYIRYLDGIAPVTRLPALGDHPRFAMVNIDGSSRTIVVDGDHPSHTLILDVNGNGDLTDDAELTMAPEDGDTHSATFDVAGTPHRFVTGDFPGKMIFHHAVIERRGQLPFTNGDMLFALRGYQGHYDEPGDHLLLDLDRDGVLAAGLHSDELFKVENRVLRIDGTDYEFSVARDGSRITFVRSETPGVERVRLAPGVPAPDFSFLDLDGALHRLSDYRGKVVLLYSWGTWCGPCREDTPGMVQLYSEFQSRGLEILGLNRRDGPEAVRSYVVQHDIRWPQSLQGDDAPVLTLYRIDYAPASVLIDEEGTIVAWNLRGRALADRIEELLEVSTSPR